MALKDLQKHQDPRRLVQVVGPTEETWCVPSRLVGNEMEMRPISVNIDNFYKSQFMTKSGDW